MPSWRMWFTDESVVRNTYQQIISCMNRNKVVFFFSDEGPTLETLDYTIRIGSTPTFLYFDLYLYSAYAAHYVYDMI